MAMSRGSGALGFLLTLTFALGFFAGYKAKELRIKWLKRRRDRLVDRLEETQRQIEMHQRNY